MSEDSCIGKRFGRLTVLGESIKRLPSGDRPAYRVVCECGKEKIVKRTHLKSGRVRSCGCMRDDAVRSRAKHGHTSGGKFTRAYTAWANMISRCTDKNRPQYDDYGGRGITVCKQWEDFENFLADMGEPPDGMSLDRKDNNKGYCPDNCRWATRKEQSRNKRNNRLVTCNGKTQCVAAWAEESGIDQRTLHDRLSYGWTIDKVVAEPVRRWK